jgi:phosphohistidine phosphatase
MKKLLIMRHAKSSWKDSGISDHERPLKKRGLKDAAEIGKILKRKELVPDKILSSDAVRAADTAAIVADKSGYKKEIEYSGRLYMAEGSVIVDLIHSQPDSIKTLLVVGHNPGMEALVQLLSKKIESLGTANVACFEADIKSWKDLTLESKIKLKKFWKPSEE